MQANFSPLGLTADTPVLDLSPEIRAALEHGYAEGSGVLQQALRGGHVEQVNGWLLTFHAFDYNLDNFQVSALDDPAWKITDPEERLVTRAGAALGGLWGNHGYEAAYITTYVDQDGTPLTGLHEYSLTLDPTPPNKGFWSLTMYDVPDYFLVENPAHRYSIGDRTPGVQYDDNGGLTIHISTTEPQDLSRRANWLPAPNGPFRPMLRVYIPDKSILDSRYVLPAIQRLPRRPPTGRDAR